MAGKEGEGTSGIGLTGMFGPTCRVGGVCGGLALSNGAGRGKELTEEGMEPRPRAWGSPPHKELQWWKGRKLEA
jgi:hypothetical protein